MRTAVLLGVVIVLSFFACAEKKKKEVKKDVEPIQRIASPAATHSSLPYLFSEGDHMLMSWVEKIGDSATVLKYAGLRKGRWETPKAIVQGSDWFVNWADFPAITKNNGNLLSHVLKKSSEGTYSYDVKLSVLPKDEKDWKNNLDLHTDGTPTEHGFVTALPFGKDSFFVTWLDGRNTGEKEGEERGAMTIRAAEVSPTGDIGNESLLDVRTCDCCQTTAAITTNGPVVVYRDRSETEIRDISIVRKTAGEWSAPKTIHADNWKIKGCPVNGPKAAVFENHLVVAWFTAADEKPTVKLVFSEDGGEHFDTPIAIGDPNAMGRVDVQLSDAQTAIISYMEAVDGIAKLKAVKVHRSGEVGKPITITELDASRKTGFPQMELVQDKVYFAWTDISGSESRVRTAYLSVGEFEK